MPSPRSPTITSGRFRGRRLSVPEGKLTRPTRSLVRQALFDMLGPAVLEASVLDLYSGSGALGLEALSRGARRVVLVEQHRRALACLRANLEALAPDDDEVRLVPGDARSWRPCGWEPYDLVQADPPFPLVDALPPALGEPGVLAEGALLALHLPSERGPPDLGPAWEPLRDKTHGRSRLLILRRT